MHKISLFTALVAAVLSVASLNGAEALKGRLITAEDIESKQNKHTYILREFQGALERSSLYVVGGKHRDFATSRDGYALKNLEFLAPYVKRIPAEANITMPRGSNLSATIDRFSLRVGAVNNHYKDIHEVIHEDCKAAKCTPIKQVFEEGDKIKKVPINASQARSLNNFFATVQDVNKLTKDLEKELNTLENELTKTNRNQREANRKANKSGVILGSSPLIASAADGTPPEFIRTIAKEKERLKGNFSIDATNNMGDTALIGLCRNNKTGNLSVLLRENPNVNAANINEETALMVASAHNNSVLLRQLLRLTPDLDAQNKSGETALHYAAKHDAADSIKILLEAGANASIVDKTGNTPLVFCALNGKINGFNALLASDGWTAPVKDGKNVIQLVIESQNLPMFEEILKSLKPDDRIYSNGEALTHIAARIKTDTSVEQFKMLVDKSADLNILNNNAETPLHIAVTLDNIPLAKYLLDQKVNLEIQSNDGTLAKDLASSEAIKALFAPSTTAAATAAVTKETPKIESDKTSNNTEATTGEEPKSNKKWWFIGIGGAVLLMFLLKK